MKRLFFFIIALCLLAAGYTGFKFFEPNIIAWRIGFPQPRYRVQVEKNVMVPSSDGTLLATDIYRPVSPGRFPVVLLRTPYDKTNPRHKYPRIAKLFAAQGYVYLVQDVRGKHQSEETFIPYEAEAEDGHATIEWAGNAPWSNGRVGLIGFSYPGSCAWLAATRSSPYLKTIISLSTSPNTYRGWFDQGVPYLKDMLFWMSKYHGKTVYPITHEEVDKVLTYFPAEELDFELNKKYLKTYQDYLHHPTPSPFWERLSADQQLGKIDLPILFFGGWYDRFSQPIFDEFTLMQSQGSAPLKVVVGPWVHDPMQKAGDLPFPENAKFIDQFKTMLDWLNIYLNGQNPNLPQEAPITYFVMGQNEWRHANQWPPTSTSYQPRYLSSRKSLSRTPDEAPQQLSYTYDPQNPAPSIGTTMIYANGWEGAREQSSITDRGDVLTFISEPLEKEVIIAGPSKLILHISSSAVDTDFSAKLADRHPDGKAYFLQSGYVRMRYRDSLKEPKLMEPEKVYKVEIPINSTSHAFKEGHRIQLQITSSDYPNHSRNPNKAKTPEEVSSPQTALQTIYFGGEYESKLLLPVLHKGE